MDNAYPIINSNMVHIHSIGDRILLSGITIHLPHKRGQSYRRTILVDLWHYRCSCIIWHCCNKAYILLELNMSALHRMSGPQLYLCCEHCHNYFKYDYGKRRRFCTDAHKQAAWRLSKHTITKPEPQTVASDQL